MCARTLTLAALSVLVLIAGPEGIAQDHPVPPSAGMPARPKFVQVYGHRLAYYEAGEGTTLVLVHGQGTSAPIDWGQVFIPFARSYHVIAVDQIGFGFSDKPPDVPGTLQTRVDYLAELLRQLKVTDFYLNGESMGGSVVALYAAEAAQPGSTLPKPRKLVITAGDVQVTSEEAETSLAAATAPRAPVAGPGNARGRIVRPVAGEISSAEAYMQGAERALFATTPGYVTLEYARDAVRLFNAYLANFDENTPPVEASAAEYQATRAMFRDHLKDIDVPTLIVWGNEDIIIRVHNARALHERIPRSSLLIYERTGHVPAVQRPLRYVADVRAFLGR